jgi:glutathionyl-hydroquinone reductase
MGMLVDGRWTDGNEAKAKTDASGTFNRAESGFRNWVTRDGRKAGAITSMPP